MKKGELCESCNTFNEGVWNVVKCPICGRDVCNFCRNLQLCGKCFEGRYYNYNSHDGAGYFTIRNGRKYKYIVESGEEIGEWIECT